MLIFILSFSVMLLPILSFSVMLLPILSFSALMILFLDFSCVLNGSCLSHSLFQDELSLFMSIMSCLVFFLGSLFMPRSSILCNFCVIFIFFLSVALFSTSNLLFLYACYECSLIPIVIIILNWGSYPDRSFSCFIMLLFTSIFTLPFIYYIFYFYFEGGSFCLHSNSSSIGLFGSILFLFAFGVNLPIYGLHFWLPMAHVEAPTFGSIILAGVLLNLGGAGLIRVFPLIDGLSLIWMLLGYFVLFSAYSSLVCCFQSDFKRLVAYSSVAHMMLVPILVLADELLSLNMAFVGMFIHGLSSPLMFILVSVCYSIFSTRQLLLMRGILGFSPILSFVLVLSFFVSVSAPPFPGFLSEVFSFVSIYKLSYFIVFPILCVPMLSLVYNVLWLSSTTFSTSSSTLNVSNAILVFKSFYPIFISIVIFLPILLFFYSF